MTKRRQGHKKPAPSDRKPRYGFHETNLAPWEQPYAVEDDQEWEDRNGGCAALPPD